MSKKLITSPSPHIRGRRTTQNLMGDVVIALLPALAAACYLFGARALLLSAVCVFSCVFFEWTLCRLLKMDSAIGDLSAVVTGLLLAFNLPAALPLWMAVIGSFTAIVVVKGLFGGIGQNFANPAIVARIVLFVSFSSAMTTWVKPFSYQYPTADVITTATPLALMRNGRWTEYADLFWGTTGGCLGETCAAALLLGGVYLVIRRVISPLVPLVYLGTVALGAFLGGQDVLFHLLSGGLMLGAIFMATDYTTSPTTTWGRVLFAFGCGAITILIRLFGSYAEGVSFAILFMNLLTPYLEKATLPRVIGGATE
ncbi:RnfABCDGE type electron transport complex subunit D [Clostridiaceae bacterium NSJ-31]|uniref:Ion-translocating oxidoreductase complex subunit D n=1 Tax=Ligaoa zhengdingensis TaxID=2763658 RepID=A0A926DWY2_9FIRM|nr:RnfABCDGE type electron transport complex subunit D [Ligaoa zhengdingensis]MBC8546775.1 RnfABCDGE type electron transport complex subunit D [Ligaoa zhengdingensis]